MSLSIGEIVGGVHKGNYEFGLLLRDVLLLIDDVETTGVVEGKPLLVVVFELPGDITTPSFSGQRIGRLSTKEETLQIETAVPDKVLLSMDATDFILKSIRSAIAMAGERFSKRGLSFDAPAHIVIVDEIEKRLSSKDQETRDSHPFSDTLDGDPAG